MNSPIPAMALLTYAVMIANDANNYKESHAKPQIRQLEQEVTEDSLLRFLCYLLFQNCAFDWTILNSALCALAPLRETCFKRGGSWTDHPKLPFPAEMFDFYPLRSSHRSQCRLHSAPVAAARDPR